MKLRNKKTGEVFEGVVVVCEVDDGANFAIKDKPICDTIAELNERFEDYTQQEPRLKNEDIRKLVMIFANIHGITSITYKKLCGFVQFSSLDDVIRIAGCYMADDLEEGRYTITELCGEGE